MLTLALMLLASPPAAEPDVLGPTMGAAIGATVPVIIATGMIIGATLTTDEAAVFTLASLGVPMLGAGGIGAAVGAVIGTGEYHPLEIGLAAFCGGLAGAVVGVGGGFALWAVAAPDSQQGIYFPIAGALLFETAGASIATALMVGAVE